MRFTYSYDGLGAYPHNWWLQLAAEWGISALIAFAIAFRCVDRADEWNPRDGRQSSIVFCRKSGRNRRICRLVGRHTLRRLYGHPNESIVFRGRVCPCAR